MTSVDSIGVNSSHLPYPVGNHWLCAELYTMAYTPWPLPGLFPGIQGCGKKLLPGRRVASLHRCFWVESQRAEHWVRRGPALRRPGGMREQSWAVVRPLPSGPPLGSRTVAVNTAQTKEELCRLEISVDVPDCCTGQW